MKSVSHHELQERGLDVLKGSNGPVLIVRDGRAVAQLVPGLQEPRSQSSPPDAERRPGPQAHLIGSLKGVLMIRGDIYTTGLAWDAES